MTPTVAVCLILALMPGQKKGQNPPKAGTVFLVADDRPRWATCDIEFRDPTGTLWPNFFSGKPEAKGSFTFDPKQPKVALVLKCDQQAQKAGDQSRRVLGELLADGKAVTASLSLANVDAPTTETRKEVDRKGKAVEKVVEFLPVGAVLEAAGKRVAVKGRAMPRWQYAKNAADPEAVYLEIEFTLEPAMLGLKNASGPLQCRAGVTAYVTLPEAKKK